MKKLLFLCVGLCFTGASFAQEGVKAVTTDGKEVLLKTDGTWAYTQGTTTTDENVCVLEEINEQKSRKDGFLKATEGRIKDLKKHVSVDENTTIDKIKVISASEQRGNGLYNLCVDGKKMKYKRVGSVFLKDGQKLF